MNGYITPFFQCKPAYFFKNLEDIDQGLKKITSEFDNSIHTDICPIVIALLGNGRVAAGVL